MVVKVNDNGTPEYTDDTLLSGATFELRLDDGDGIYEPDTDDAPVIDTVVSEFGFAVFDPQPVFGNYWITEIAAPVGFDVAAPLLVPYTADNVQENCVSQPERLHLHPGRRPDRWPGRGLRRQFTDRRRAALHQPAAPATGRQSAALARAGQPRGGLWRRVSWPLRAPGAPFPCIGRINQTDNGHLARPRTPLHSPE